MKFSGRYQFDAPRREVWDALNDAEMLKAAIPRCTKLVWVSDCALEATIEVNLGLVKPTFTGDLVLSNVDPAVKYTLSGSGRGGLLGLAHGAADIALRDRRDGTLLTFTAEAGASGQIMRLGKNLVGASAQRIIDGFFLQFADAMQVSITPEGSLDQ